MSYSPRAHYAEVARENAYAGDWHTTDAAKALIARWLFADEVSELLAGHDLTSAQVALMDDMGDIEIALGNIRDERVSDEIDTLSERDREDFYACDDIEASAPQVDAVLEAARKEARNADVLALAPVTRIGATRIAA